MYFFHLGNMFLINFLMFQNRLTLKLDLLISVLFRISAAAMWQKVA